MSRWKDCVTAALLGTERSAPPALPGALEFVGPATAAMPREAQFLTQAGALALWRRAGWTPPSATLDRSAPADPESHRYVSSISGGHLRAMLKGDFSNLLSEWLGEAARVKRIAPPELLPALLERARANRDLRPLALVVGGERGRWLAARNPDWEFAAPEPIDDWETGSRDQRIRRLRLVRARTPQTARVMVESVWKPEPADTRAAFLAELRADLSPDDVPFLESALDDRSKEVRRVAVDLLSQIPNSPLVERMLVRAASILSFKAGGLLKRASLEVTLPGEPDPAGTRDGLDPKGFGQQKTLGGRAVVLVQVLASIPLTHWTTQWGQPPEVLLKAAEKTEFGRAIATGWAWAALRKRNAEWAAAILDGPIHPHTEFLPGPLLSILPEPERAERLASIVRAGGLQKPDADAWKELSEQLFAFTGYWPESLGREVLAGLRRVAAQGIPWFLRAHASNLAMKIPPSLLADALHGWPLDREGVASLADFLTFRHEMLTALHDPTA